jgi:GT2 family glycosyltransferase
LEDIAAQADLFSTTHFSNTNVGFSKGHNQIIGSEPSDYVLLLNPDVVLDPSFIEVLVHSLEKNVKAGSATGKLLRLHEDGSKLDIVDTTGIYFTPNQRHLDRGSGERDVGRYEAAEYVFGASGAAAFHRRKMLEDVRTGGEYLDEDFWCYREDADLAWRAQWMGWTCLYVPEATGFHVRRVLPERRAILPADINMHSYKNRFLLRIKNLDAGTYWRFFVPITLRDLAAFVYVLARERSSLQAIPLVLRAFPKAWALRRAMARHRRVSPKEMRAWFSWKPVARPIESGAASQEPGFRSRS